MTSTPRSAPVTAPEAIGLFVLAFILAQLVGGLAGVAVGDVTVGTLVGYVVFVAIPAYRAGFTALGMRATHARFVAGAAICGASYWGLDALLSAIIPLHFDNSKMESIVVASPIATAISFIVFAPLAEELVFRGMLLPALVRRFGAVRGVVMVSVLFSLFHLNPAQLIPAFVSGLGLGALALRSRSIVPGIVAHAINNSVAVLLFWSGLDAPVEAHLGLAIALALAVLAAGVALLRKGPTRAA